MRSLSHRLRGFTLVELLVTIAIILITTLVALPVIVSSLNGKSVTDATGVLTSAIAGARDAAIRQNEPRGIRLMPDPTLTLPAQGQPKAGTLQLAFNRIIPIEPAASYSSGQVNIGPQLPAGQSSSTFPPPYARQVQSTDVYPFPATGVATATGSLTPQVLMVEESPFQGGFIVSPGTIPNEPTNWFWNVRLGDKIKFNGTGRAYTIVGPCTISPWALNPQNIGNPELFVNAGAPGTTPPLQRTYYTRTPTGALMVATQYNPEFLFLVNGDDDDKDGLTDEGWDNFDFNLPIGSNGVVDELAEWETEAWEGSKTASILVDPGDGGPNSPSTAWSGFGINLVDSGYSIDRRPVPSPGAREVLLPAGVVIDATTWQNGLPERSRLPVDPAALTVDIMLHPNGLYVPTTAYSSPTSGGVAPFLHFWLTDRNDVFPIGQVTGQTYLLPMSLDATKADPNNAGFQLPGPGNYPPAGNPTFPVLKNDRRLVTLFAQSGMVVTNTMDAVPNVFNTTPNAVQILLPGEGFNINDVNQPFYRAQLGQREVK